MRKYKNWKLPSAAEFNSKLLGFLCPYKVLRSPWI